MRCYLVLFSVKALPGNRITAIAGEAATGKTFFALGIVKSF